MSLLTVAEGMTHGSSIANEVNRRVRHEFRKTSLKLGSLAVLLLWTLSGGVAHATSQCWVYSTWMSGAPGGWYSDPNVVAQLYLGYCNSNPKECAPVGLGCQYEMCTFSSASAEIVTYPAYQTVVVGHSAYPNGNSGGTDFAQPLEMGGEPNPNGCQVYASATPPATAQCGRGCNGVSDPINPNSGGTYKAETDLSAPSGGLQFLRFYNSTDTSVGGDLDAGWRHSFSRSIKPRYGGTGYAGSYVASPYNSSLYTDEATACTSGFSQIKGRISAWANATASYANGVCTLSVGGTSIGALALLYSSPPTPDPSTEILIGYDATRDDGQVVSFLLQGGVITPPPSISLRLQQTSSGFTLKDNDDTVEAYDATGKLSTVTPRTGGSQTMSYDTSGRLATVVDSFGHGFTLTYNAQGQLSQVSQP